MRALLHPWVPCGKPAPLQGKLLLGSSGRTLSEKDVLDHPSAIGLLSEDASWQSAVLDWWLRRPRPWQVEARHSWRREGRRLREERPRLRKADAHVRVRDAGPAGPGRTGRCEGRVPLPVHGSGVSGRRRCRHSARAASGRLCCASSPVWRGSSPMRPRPSRRPGSCGVSRDGTAAGRARGTGAGTPRSLAALCRSAH